MLRKKGMLLWFFQDKDLTSFLVFVYVTSDNVIFKHCKK